MKKISSIILVSILMSTTSFAQSICNEILKQGAFDYYELQSEKHFDYIFKKLVVMSREEIEQQINNRTLEASIPIPFAETFLNLAYGDDENRYKHIKEFYQNNTEVNISTDDRTWLVSKIANEKIVSAWEHCVIDKELNLELTGDIKNDFSISLMYKPNREGPRSTILTGVTISSNLKKTNADKFKTGQRINQFNSYTQQFKRTDSNSVSLVLDIKGFPKPVKIEIPAIPKPLPKYEVRWFNTDEQGKPYYYDHTFMSANNSHPDDKCCAIMVDKNVTLAQLGITNARILDISYTHAGAGCGWNYNQNGAGGGYAGQYSISADRQSFHWWRSWDGIPCQETYRIYYEKPRGVCVKNCSDLSFLTK
jgi:hypothetical protein